MDQLTMRTPIESKDNCIGSALVEVVRGFERKKYCKDDELAEKI